MTDFMLTYAESGPDSSTISDYVMSLLAELRKRIAHLINCDHDEAVFVQSTTEGLDMVRNGLHWNAGDAIVIRGGRHERNANYLSWVALSQKKA
jgi:cysteine desulfurase / selenocysteine lyase